MADAVNWFEIPTTNIDRAAKFYGTVLGASIEVGEAMPGFKMGMFPAEDGVGGALLQGDGYNPTKGGVVVYLNGGDDLSDPLSRVVGAGGKIIQDKTNIGENGFIAFFEDTEGNKVGLHSMS